MMHVHLILLLTLYQLCSSLPMKNQSNRALEVTIPCGEIVEDYTPTDILSIGAETANQKVMVSHVIANDRMATCTMRMCTAKMPCCNSCGSSPKFENVSLVASSGDLYMGCGGTNCDYMSHCVYREGDKILVYGNVDRYGSTIEVYQHCLDPNYVSKGEEDALHDHEKCQELSNEFMLPNTTYCARLLGVGIWRGVCTSISGCSPNEHMFFLNMEECKSTCLYDNITSSDLSNVDKDNTTTITKIRPSNITDNTNLSGSPSSTINNETTENQAPENQAYKKSTAEILCNCLLLSMILCFI